MDTLGTSDILLTVTTTDFTAVALEGGGGSSERFEELN
jgi:hypothetical protein